jgi:hypothetical protein
VLGLSAVHVVGVHAVSKIAIVAVLLAAGVGYLAFDPSAAQDVANWVRRQVGSTPKVRDVGSPNYMPVTPAKGL